MTDGRYIRRLSLSTVVKFLFILVLGLSLALAVLVGVLHLYPQWLNRPVQAGLGLLLDRSVVIGELASVDLGAETSLLARDVRIGNPGWADEPYLVNVDRLRLVVDLPSLWRTGPVIIRELQVDDFRVTLLAPEGRPPNWQFGGEAPEEEAETTGELQLPVVIQTGRLQRGSLLFRDPDQEVRLLLDRLQLRDPGGGALIDVEVAGILNDIPFSGDGGMGPAQALLTGRDLAVRFDSVWGDVRFEGEGRIGDLASLAEPELYFVLAAPRARPLLDALGVPEIRDGALRLEGRLSAGAPGLVLDVHGSLNEFTLNLAGSAGKPLALDDLAVELSFAGPSLREAGAAFEIMDLPAIPYALDASISRAGSMLEVFEGSFAAGDSTLTFKGRLPRFPEIDDWQFDFAGRQLELAPLGPVFGVSGLPAERYELSGRLRATDTGTELVELQFVGPNASLALDGQVGDEPGYRGSRVRVALSGDDFSANARWLGLGPLPADPFRLEGELGFSREGWEVAGGRLSVGALLLELSGTLDSLQTPTALSGTFNLSTPDLAETLADYGMGAARLGRFPLQLRGRVEGTPSLLRLPEASFESAQTRGSARGVLGNPADLSGLVLTFAVAGPDLAQFAAPGGDRLPAALPFSLRGTVARVAGGWEAREVAGDLAHATIALDGRLAATTGFQGSALTFSASGDDLAVTLRPWTERPLPAEPFAVELAVNVAPRLLQIRDLGVRVGEVELAGHLDLNDPPDFSDTRGLLTLSGPSARDFLRLLGAELEVSERPLSASLRIAGTPDSVRLDDINVVLGESDLAGRASVRFGQARVIDRPDRSLVETPVDVTVMRVPEIQADLHSRTIDLPFLIPDLDKLEDESRRQGEALAAGGADAGRATVARTRIIPDVPLDFRWIEQVNGSLRYRVDRIVMREGVESSADIDVSLRDGVLATRRLAWEGSLSTGSAEVRVEVLETGGEVDVYVDSKRVPLIWLLAGEPDDQVDRTYRLRLRGNGDTLRGLAGNLNGAFLYEGGGGRVSNRGLGLIFGDVVDEVVTRLNPFVESEPYTRVVCSAGAMRFVNGVIEVVPGLVLRTDKVDVASGGSIDLRDERLDLTFRTRSRKGVGISAAKAIAPYVKIGGTLSDPRLMLDSKGVAVSGGAAVATAGLSIIAEGLWDRWVATANNPCERLFSRASAETKAEFRALLERPDFSAGADVVSP